MKGIDSDNSGATAEIDATFVHGLSYAFLDDLVSGSSSSIDGK